jgi:hypothetical protein
MDGMLVVIQEVQTQDQNQAQILDGMSEVTQEAQTQDRNQDLILDGISIIHKHQLDPHHHIQACKIVQFQAIILPLPILQVIIIHQLTAHHTLILHLITHQATDHHLLTVHLIVLLTDHHPLIVHHTILQATIADLQLHMEVTFPEPMYMELSRLAQDIIQTVIKIIMEILSADKEFLEIHTSQIIIMGINVQVDQDF